MARAHTAGEEKHGNMATGWLRLLVFSSFCSGKGVTPGNRKSYNDAVLIIQNPKLKTRRRRYDHNLVFILMLNHILMLNLIFLSYLPIFIQVQNRFNFKITKNQQTCFFVSENASTKIVLQATARFFPATINMSLWVCTITFKTQK